MKNVEMEQNDCCVFLVEDEAVLGMPVRVIWISGISAPTSMVELLYNAVCFRQMEQCKQLLSIDTQISFVPRKYSGF